MFDIQIGDKLSLNSTKLSSPLLVLGNAGQGKITTLKQITLELIKNKQKGVLYDPYGHLSQDIKASIQSSESKKNVQFFPDSVDEKEIKESIKSKFLII